MQTPEWVLVNEFDGSQTYVDRASIRPAGPLVTATVRYVLNPPGTDKRNNRPVREMSIQEEYDTSLCRVRIHSIVFTYTDGTLSTPLSMEPSWFPATNAYLKTLHFLRDAGKPAPVAPQELTRMHAEATVRRESVIAWYRWYSQFASNRLPPMNPERSEVDLVRTIALWMELTDGGGSPGFPYEYRTDLTFSTLDPDREPPKSLAFPIGVALIALSLVAIWFTWKLGIGLLVAGGTVLYFGYRLSGGSSNPHLLTKGTTLYEKEGRRVLQWVARQRIRESPDADRLAVAIELPHSRGNT